MMRKVDAMLNLWYDKLELMSYSIGDSDGAFDTNTMEDFETLETLVYVANGRRVYRKPAELLLSLFASCDPDHNYTDSDAIAPYDKMFKRMNKLAEAISHPPLTYGRNPTE